VDQGLDISLQPVRPRSSRRPGRRSGIVAVLALAAVGLWLVAADDPHATARPLTPVRPSRIAVVDASGLLSTVAVDGSDPHAYPLPGFTVQFPAWSPDGRSVAAIATGSGEGRVVVIDDRAAGGSGAPAVVYRTDASLIYLSWAPGGRRIGVLTGEAGDLALRLVAADGVADPSVIARGQPLYWDWIDSGRLFVHSGANRLDAFLGDVGAEALTRVPLTASVGPFQAPAVSAGGRYRAYVAGGPIGGPIDAPRVVVEAPDGLVRHEAAVDGPSAFAWNPRRDELAYTAPLEPNLPVGSLRVLDAATGLSRELLAGLVVAYQWAPDGRTVAAIRLVLPDDVNTASLGSPAAVRLAAATRPPARAGSALAAPSPLGAATDGPQLRLVFVDATTGALRSETTIALPGVIVGQFLPFFDQYARSHRLWSPASDAVVLPLVDSSGVSHITIVPAGGSPPRRIADGVEAFWSP
jgi:TolB protein